MSSADKGGAIELSSPGKEHFSQIPQDDAQNEVLVPFSSFNVRANRRTFNDLTRKHHEDQRRIQLLLALLKEHNISPPDFSANEKNADHIEEEPLLRDRLPSLLDGSAESMTTMMEHFKNLVKIYKVTIQYRDLNFWTMAPEPTIPTVGSTVRAILLGTGPKKRADILKGLTGQLKPGRMTLVMGPPGSGKTTFLKAISGLLNVTNPAKLDGSITYNGMRADEGKFLVPKLVDYVNETDVHSAILTVRETLEFAFKANSGLKPNRDLVSADGAAVLDAMTKDMRMVRDVLTILGLSGCADTVVGDDMLKGISGGQKRRVTLGEMLVCRHSVKCLDAISNGLDAATTFDINNAFKIVARAMGHTVVTSLLQPSPEVFGLFDDLVLLSQGTLIYHGPRDQVASYFENLGYVCPEHMDIADFLQELPTREGRRFISDNFLASGGADPNPDGGIAASPGRKYLGVPLGTAELAQSWKDSSLNRQLLADMDAVDAQRVTGGDVQQMPASANEKWAEGLGFYFRLLLERQRMVVYRDVGFLRARVMQSTIVGLIAGSLMSNIETTDFQTMNSVLFFGALNCAMGAMSLLPTVFQQRNVFYKQSKAYFFPASAFVFAQTVALIPVLLLETCIFCSILYWWAGLSDTDGGARYFTFLTVVISLALAVGQFYRALGSVLPTLQIAQPLCGVSTTIFVLFSGFIIPKSSIPDGWIWFYYINPVAWALQSVTINEFTAPDYDFQVCTSVNPSTGACGSTGRFGDQILQSRGLSTDVSEVWTGVGILWVEYLVFLALTALALTFVRAEPVPPPPIIEPELLGDEEESGGAGTKSVEIQFEPVSFAFRDVWYTVQVAGDELDLLKGVNGHCEPGTVTALMGSSGAGKTTLLDVLAGRKNTGRIAGEVFVNGRPKDDRSFRRIMGYVEQFDSLCPHDTAREALEFSAALRLPESTPDNVRSAWVESVLDMLELTSLGNTLVGDSSSQGMSFEQKKRVSIGVELVANPAILFLDEPTSGLDSRAAQVVMRCIKRVAASGRAVVCTIHQPSVVIFEAFDSLLLLRRGGQTVFFGPLGEDNCNLQEHFESASPSVPRLRQNQNAATWMLEVIGAGTGSTTLSAVDFHLYYKNSALCVTNNVHLDSLCAQYSDADAARAEAEAEANAMAGSLCRLKPVSCAFGNDALAHLEQIHRARDGPKYNATYSRQFTLLMKRAIMSYWRSPSYNFVRMVISVIIALIFASTYADQNYSQEVDVIARTSVIYITALFTGVVGMMTVQPVFFSERPAFYREKQSEMYSVFLYTVAAGVVELPYLAVSSLLFTLPFFFIVGFDQGDVASKFGWYWLFEALYMSCLVFCGQFLAALMPDAPSAGVIGGVLSTVLSLFAGFMIREENFPSFWVFLYWLNPLHYVLEGLNVTQFYNDGTVVSLINGQQTTAEAYIEGFYATWRYDHRIYDVAGLVGFICAFRIGTYFALKYVNNKKN